MVLHPDGFPASVLGTRPPDRGPCSIGHRPFRHWLHAGPGTGCTSPARRDAYFEALDSNRTGDLEPIVGMFVLASLTASDELSVTAIRIRGLPDQWLTDLGRSRGGGAPRVLMGSVLVHPVLPAADAEKFLGSGTTVADTALARHEAAGVLSPQCRAAAMWIYRAHASRSITESAYSRRAIAMPVSASPA